MAFDIAYVGYKNEQENIHFIREMPIKQEATETSEVVEMCQPQSPPLSTPTLEAEKRNANHQKREKRSANVKLLLKLWWKKKMWWKQGKTFEWTRNKRFAYETYKFQYL